MSPLRVALAQLNVTVGDLEGNRRLIEAAIRRAQAWRADVVAVPELAITGYPPEDLLLKPSFVEASHRVLERLIPLTEGITAVVGGVDRGRQGTLYNTATVLANGRVAAVYRKRCLPNYGVFDEKRYFTPGTRAVIITTGGVRIGLTICEDLWEPAPCRELAAAGAQLVMNLSASPYYAGKLHERQRLFSRRAKQHHLAIAYCNLVGGQDELIFDGASLFLDAQGRLVARGRQFQEDFVVVDVPPRHGATASGRGPLALASARGWAGCRPTRGVIKGATDSARGAPQAREDRPPLIAHRPPALPPVEEVYEALTLGVRDYVRKNGFSTVVLGLSGGVDSALTACLATDALGADHVVGVVMPSRFSSRATQEDARRLAKALGIARRQIAIEPMFEAYLRTLQPLFGRRPWDVTEQNLQARIRGNLLMALSNKFGWLVLTTGNKSEFATGYCTLYGDMAGGFAVIKDVPKTLVYSLARFRNRKGPGAPIPQSVLTRAPTAELAPRQTDQDTLPPYDVLDRILKAYVEDDCSVREILGRHHAVPPATARRVLKMVDRSEYKRRQGPPGIKMTPKAFGKDRRMPITNRYHES